MGKMREKGVSTRCGSFYRGRGLEEAVGRPSGVSLNAGHYGLNSPVRVFLGQGRESDEEDKGNSGWWFDSW